MYHASNNVMVMKEDILNDELVQRLIKNLQHEGFESLVDYDEEDEYVTLTIKQNTDPKVRIIKIY